MSKSAGLEALASVLDDQKTAAAITLAAQRYSMSREELANNPLTLEQCELLVGHSPELEVRIPAAHQIITILTCSAELHERGAEVLNVLGGVLFQEILPSKLSGSFLLRRFTNCAWSYDRKAWHARGLTALGIRPRMLDGGLG